MQTVCITGLSISIDTNATIDINEPNVNLNTSKNICTLSDKNSHDVAQHDGLLDTFDCNSTCNNNVNVELIKSVCSSTDALAADKNSTAPMNNTRGTENGKTEQHNILIAGKISCVYRYITYFCMKITMIMFV